MTSNPDITPALSEQQLSAIALLSQGVSQSEVARQLNVSRKTIGRWSQQEAFKAELERRKQRTTELHQQESDRLQEEQIASFYKDIREYRRACLDAYRSRLAIAVKGLRLLTERINSLTPEEIPPQLLPGMVGAINSLMDSALAGWADTLAIDELITRLSEDNGAEGRS